VMSFDFSFTPGVGGFLSGKGGNLLWRLRRFILKSVTDLQNSGREGLTTSTACAAW